MGCWNRDAITVHKLGTTPSLQTEKTMCTSRGLDYPSTERQPPCRPLRAGSSVQAPPRAPFRAGPSVRGPPCRPLCAGPPCRPFRASPPAQAPLCRHLRAGTSVHSLPCKVPRADFRAPLVTDRRSNNNFVTFFRPRTRHQKLGMLHTCDNDSYGGDDWRQRQPAQGPC